MRLPILYHKAKNGDLRQWRVWTEGPDIRTEHGQVGGQLQRSKKTAVSKNIGRSNETSPDEQAELEAAALYKHKLERKYSLTKEEAQEELSLPMLAHKFADKSAKATYPAHVQPKLDGVRCLASRDSSGNISLTSRQGKEYIVPHIQEQLEWLSEDMTLDGEIYIHGETLQRITSLVKSANPKGKSFKQESLELEYHVYDMPVCEGDDTTEWFGRECNLRDHLKVSKNVLLVECGRVRAENEVWNAHNKYTEEGYEGAILRLYSGLYLWGYRSSQLLKVKAFNDGEFKVVGAKDGRGKMAGHIIWICKNDVNDETFDCSMKTSMAERCRMFKEQKKYIGKMLTVRYFNRTEDKIPTYNRGIAFRDAADLP